MTDKLKFSSKSIENFLKEVKDISYVIDGNSKIKLVNEYQYTDLLLLYEQNSKRKPEERALFYKDKDKNGELFVRLTSEGEDYIKNYDMFFEHKKRDIKGYNNAINNAVKVYSTDSNEFENTVYNSVDNSIKKSSDRIRRSKDLKAIIAQTPKKNMDFNEKSSELITIKYKPQFYDCDDFDQFNLSKN